MRIQWSPPLTSTERKQQISTLGTQDYAESLRRLIKHETRWSARINNLLAGVCVYEGTRATRWGRWMMDAMQESYETASSGLMASGRYTPAPRADLVVEGWHSDSTFSVLRSLYPFSLPHSQWDSWIYSAISSLALCCAEQSILQQTGLLYRVLHQLQMRDRQATHSRRSCGGALGGTKRTAGGPLKLDFQMYRTTHVQYAVFLNPLLTALLTWSNCASSPLWRDRDKGFSCKKERERFDLSVQNIFHRYCWDFDITTVKWQHMINTNKGVQYRHLVWCLLNI